MVKEYQLSTLIEDSSIQVWTSCMYLALVLSGHALQLVSRFTGSISSDLGR